MQKLGKIHDLREQRPWPLIPAQKLGGKVIERACCYVSDFDYVGPDGGRVVEDCKGVRTPAYIIKRKLMLWVHGVRIKET